MQSLGYDLVLVGGGLQSALVAGAFAIRRPTARIALLEKASTLFGNHTWSFHRSDVPEDCGALVSPMISSRWSSYEVRFPDLERRIESEYASVSSEYLRTWFRKTCTRVDVFAGVAAKSVASGSVELEDGRIVRAPMIVDARGPSRVQAPTLGFQKFVGLEVEGTGFLRHATLMDATVEQLDGFRFMYVLPSSPNRALIEDTYYANGPELDREALRTRIFEYARSRGYQIDRVLREESGTLPLPKFPTVVEPRDGVVTAGYAGGWYHPVTGYSFPVALRLAWALAGPEALDQVARLAKEVRSQQRFFVFLNRLLFSGFDPSKRYRALERFHRMPDEVMQRFYALRLFRSDQLRLVCGRPPRDFQFVSALAGGPS